MTPKTASVQGYFRSTLWTQVLAVKHADAPSRQQALEVLLERYWKPIYAYVRRSGWPRADAEDLTQEFIARMLKIEFWKHPSPERGRFRSFLQTCLKNFLADEVERRRTLKRGGGRILSMNFEAAEAEIPASSDSPPETAFDRQWAHAILERAFKRLEEECRTSNRLHLFEALRESTRLTPSGQRASYSQLAQKFGVTETQLTNYLHRARTRLSELLKEEVEETCADPAVAREEFLALKQIFG